MPAGVTHSLFICDICNDLKCLLGASTSSLSIRWCTWRRPEIWAVVIDSIMVCILVIGATGWCVLLTLSLGVTVGYAIGVMLCVLPWSKLMVDHIACNLVSTMAWISWVDLMALVISSVNSCMVYSTLSSWVMYGSSNWLSSVCSTVCVTITFLVLDMQTMQHLWWSFVVPT